MRTARSTRTTRTTRTRGRVGLAVAGTATLAVSLAAPAAAAAPESLEIRAAGSNGRTVDGAAQFSVTGTTTVDIDVATVSAGRARLVSGPGGDVPSAVRFPAYVGSGSYPRAVVRLLPESGDALKPRRSDFEFGAVLNLDSVSSGRSNDNGDNVFQRGLWEDSSQLKLEVDDGRPACTVKGNEGRKVVRARSPIDRNAWYTVRCLRVGTKLTVEVARFGDSGALERRSTWGKTGYLWFSDSRTASVGGKLTSSGHVMEGATDQFNGAIGTVWINEL